MLTTNFPVLKTTRHLDGRNTHKEQFTRYRQSLATIVFTDYLDFHLYESGALTATVRLADERGGRIVIIPEATDAFFALVDRLAAARLQPITSSARLAERMAAKARLLKSAIQAAFANAASHGDGIGRTQDELGAQYKAFKQVLIHDLKTDAFADIYAQTIVYGMFAARLNDPTPETFSRHEAAELIPQSNPFLRRIFQQISGYDLDPRIAWIVDDLVRTFRAADVGRIMKDYGKSARHADPLVHFYEDFLAAYDPKLRDQRGVYYTPQPVVRFIVSAVDHILRRDFGLAQGLADYAEIKHDVVNDAKTKTHDRKTVFRAFHRVQILDPATGTGTFLAEVVNQIHARYFANQQGLWQSYAEAHLLPRIHGFEFMMAPYAIAHLKMDMTLRNTGYVHRNGERFRIYLTNTLEECHADTGTLFASWLANEANEANYIKRDTPVMVMLGNPPYSGESRNKGEWIMALMEDYKKEPGGKIKLQERNPKWINDDYVKFVRMAQYYIERNGEGVLAFINPHGFLDNPTFRGMRWQLLKMFDDIYTLDLYGNAKKKETAPDGSKDENVFDIMQGVSINIFVKKRNSDSTLRDKEKPNGSGAIGKKDLATVHHADLYGKRADKYAFLDSTNFSDVKWTEVHPSAPQFFFLPKDLGLSSEYEKGFGIDELMTVNSVGIVTANDSVLIASDKYEILKKVSVAYHIEAEENFVSKFYYRPFDVRSIYYDVNLVERARGKVARHLFGKKNLALIFKRGFTENAAPCFVADGISEFRYWSRPGMQGGDFFAPLYLYPEEGVGETLVSPNPCDNNPTPNFNPTVLAKIESSLGEKVIPLELFDYIYAVLHTPFYRERYKEFLKIDFPRIPYPTDAARYHRLAEIGSQLRALHLMTDSASWSVKAVYPVAGDNVVEKPHYDEAALRVYINKTQYFENVSPTAWNFYIGGYQPAQKWLKDRKARALGFEDIVHYSRIIYALTETARLMGELDKGMIDS